VAAAFDDDEIFFPSGAVEGVLDPAHEGFVVGFLDVLAGEVGFDGDGTHGVERGADLVGLLDQDGVFVDVDSVNGDETLPHGFDVADAAEALAQGGEKAEAGGGFSVVLLGSGDEDTRGNVVHSGELQ